MEERALLEHHLESLGLWQGLAALPQPLPVVQRLTSAQGSVYLPAGFPDSAFFVRKTWSPPTHPLFLHFKPNSFSASLIVKLCCLQTSESWAECGSPRFFCLGSPCFQMCTFAGWINDVEEASRNYGPSYCCAGCPWFPPTPSSRTWEWKEILPSTLFAGVAKKRTPTGNHGPISSIMWIGQNWWSSSYIVLKIW